jgi:mRNA interferase HigB
MNVVSYKTIRKFIQKHPKARVPLDGWYNLAQKSHWEHFSALRKTCGSADIYGKCTIFDIGGNNYRLIAKIDYQRQTIYIKSILTHAEYDKEKWKRDCKG